jgi:glycogen operon protein
MGAEGPTEDPAINAARAQQKRNLMATLLLSQGVPMLCAGDEMGRTQRGNNNAYCQDNEISWIDWNLDDTDRELFEFTAKLIAFRQSNPVLRRQHFFSGRPIRGANVKDIAWLDPSGKEMSDAAWHEPHVRSLGVRLDGASIDEVDERGRPLRGDTVLILLNAHHEPVAFRLSAFVRRPVWECVVDTAIREHEGRRLRGGGRYELQGRSLALFRMVSHAPPSSEPAREARPEARE